MPAEAPVHQARCRLDVWLWRARFFKTRTRAAGFIEAGRVRLVRGGRVERVLKPAQAIGPADEIVFALQGRLTAVIVRGLGERRGPPSEAAGLYDLLPDRGAGPAAPAIDNAPFALTNTPARIPSGAP
jgi:ribosomal 50S subunit-recycling heat shock protein